MQMNVSVSYETKRGNASVAEEVGGILATIGVLSIQLYHHTRYLFAVVLCAETARKEY